MALYFYGMMKGKQGKHRKQDKGACSLEAAANAEGIVESPKEIAACSRGSKKTNILQSVEKVIIIPQVCNAENIK